MLEASPPSIPPVIVVPIHLLRQPRQRAVVDVENHLLTEAVEHLRNLCIAPQPVLYNPAVMQVAHISRRVNQIVHEDHVRGYVVGAVQMALLERDQVQEQRFRSIVDQQTRYFQYPIFEFYIPEPICIPPLELDPCVLQICHAVDQLLPPLVHHAAGVGPPLHPHPRRRLWPGPNREQAAAEDFEAVQPALLRQRIESSCIPERQLQFAPIALTERLIRRHQRIEEPERQPGDRAVLVRVAALNPVQPVEYKQRNLVFKHDHVALDRVHRASHCEDRVAPRVAEPGEPGGGAAEELENEACVEHHHLHELVAAEADRALVEGPGFLFDFFHRLEIELDVLIGPLEHVVESPPFVAVHAAQPSLAVVVRPQRDGLRNVGLVIVVAEALWDSVDGELGPRAGCVVVSGLVELFFNGDHPFRLLRLCLDAAGFVVFDRELTRDDEWQSLLLLHLRCFWEFD